MTRRPAADRFNEKTAPNPAGCIEWRGAVLPTGYGRFFDGRRVVYAHRWSYEQLVGPIPDGFQVDHLCRNRQCVNPKHLEAVTQRENLLRGSGWAGRNAAKTTCPAGHPYSGHNLMVVVGARRCRTCFNAERRVRYHAQKAV